MDITLIKKLREETGSGVVETKKALELHQGDYVEAKAYLLTQLKKTAGNDRVASKGLTGLVIKDDEAILYEVNAETDFVVKNPHFLDMMKEIGEALISSSAISVKDAKKVMIHHQTVEEKIEHTAAIIKEQTYLRRFYRIRKQSHQAFGFYQHLQGKISTLVILNKDLNSINHQIAMHIAASAPSYLDFDLIDKETIDYEKFMYEKSNGKMDEKAFKEGLEKKTLFTQDYILDPSIKVLDLLNKHQATVIDFYRFEVGQGIDNKLNCRLDIPCDGSQITVTPIY